jgi:hypothetical protein
VSCLLIRCRSCTPASTVELTGWIEDKVAQLSNGTPQAAVRLTRLVQDLPTATLDDGWLIEIRLEGERGEEHSDALTAALEEILRDMRILGLDPTLLVPGTLALGDEEPVLAMRRAHIKLETVPADSRPAGPGARWR